MQNITDCAFFVGMAISMIIFYFVYKRMILAMQMLPLCGVGCCLWLLTNERMKMADVATQWLWPPCQNSPSDCSACAVRTNFDIQHGTRFTSHCFLRLCKHKWGGDYLISAAFLIKISVQNIDDLQNAVTWPELANGSSDINTVIHAPITVGPGRFIDGSSWNECLPLSGYIVFEYEEKCNRTRAQTKINVMDGNENKIIIISNLVDLLTSTND